MQKMQIDIGKLYNVVGEDGVTYLVVRCNQKQINSTNYPIKAVVVEVVEPVCFVDFGEMRVGDKMSFSAYGRWRNAVDEVEGEQSYFLTPYEVRPEKILLSCMEYDLKEVAKKLEGIYQNLKSDLDDGTITIRTLSNYLTKRHESEV